MVKVCAEQFPKTEGFYMDDYKIRALDSLAKNIVKDWDFVLLVSGSGKVRVGKSVEAQQDACYLVHKANELHGLNNTFTANDFCWSGEELIAKGLKAPKYSALIYDEGTELSARDHMKKIVKNLMRFFAEVGQKNLFIFVVLPEYFDLPKGLAINRSICLIDVDWQGEFERGHFRFFSWKKKKQLYLRGKKDLNYSAVKSNFYGKFAHFYTVDEEEYRSMKAKSLKRFGEQEKGGNIKINLYFRLVKAYEHWIKELTSYSSENMSRELSIKYQIQRTGRQISKDIEKQNLNRNNILY